MDDMVKIDSPSKEISLNLSSPTSPTFLPWDNFSDWIHCACIVTFDLELGQAMEVSDSID